MTTKSCIRAAKDMLAAFVAPALALWLWTGLAAQADEVRYTIQETSDGGFLRLDQQTGGVLKCSGSNGSIVCNPVTDDNEALREELVELKAENEKLKQRVAELERLTKTKDEGLAEPAKKQIQEIFGFFEDMVRRLMQFANGLETKPGEET